MMELTGVIIILSILNVPVFSNNVCRMAMANNKGVYRLDCTIEAGHMERVKEFYEKQDLSKYHNITSLIVYTIIELGNRYLIAMILNSNLEKLNKRWDILLHNTVRTMLQKLLYSLFITIVNSAAKASGYGGHTIINIVRQTGGSTKSPQLRKYNSSPTKDNCHGDTPMWKHNLSKMIVLMCPAVYILFYCMIIFQIVLKYLKYEYSTKTPHTEDGNTLVNDLFVIDNKYDVNDQTSVPKTSVFYFSEQVDVITYPNQEMFVHDKNYFRTGESLYNQIDTDKGNNTNEFNANGLNPKNTNKKYLEIKKDCSLDPKGATIVNGKYCVSCESFTDVEDNSKCIPPTENNISTECTYIDNKIYKTNADNLQREDKIYSRDTCKNEYSFRNLLIEPETYNIVVPLEEEASCIGIKNYEYNKAMFNVVPKEHKEDKHSFGHVNKLSCNNSNFADLNIYETNIFKHPRLQRHMSTSKHLTKATECIDINQNESYTNQPLLERMQHSDAFVDQDMVPEELLFLSCLQTEGDKLPDDTNENPICDFDHNADYIMDGHKTDEVYHLFIEDEIGNNVKTSQLVKNDQSEVNMCAKQKYICDDRNYHTHSKNNMGVAEKDHNCLSIPNETEYEEAEFTMHLNTLCTLCSSSFKQTEQLNSLALCTHSLYRNILREAESHLYFDQNNSNNINRYHEHQYRGNMIIDVLWNDHMLIENKEDVLPKMNIEHCDIDGVKQSRLDFYQTHTSSHKHRHRPSRTSYKHTSIFLHEAQSKTIMNGPLFDNTPHLYHDEMSDASNEAVIIDPKPSKSCCKFEMEMCCQLQRTTYENETGAHSLEHNIYSAELDSGYASFDTSSILLSKEPCKFESHTSCEPEFYTDTYNKSGSSKRNLTPIYDVSVHKNCHRTKISGLHITSLLEIQKTDIDVRPVFRNFDTYFRTPGGIMDPIVDLSVEWLRIATFWCCPRNEKDTDSFMELASFGLFYEPSDSTIRCFSCRFVYNIAHRGIQNVNTEHHKFAPTCAQLEQRDQNNLPIDMSMAKKTKNAESLSPITHEHLSVTETGNPYKNQNKARSNGRHDIQRNVCEIGIINENGLVANFNEYKRQKNKPVITRTPSSSSIVDNADQESGLNETACVKFQCQSLDDNDRLLGDSFLIESKITNAAKNDILVTHSEATSFLPVSKNPIDCSNYTHENTNTYKGNETPKVKTNPSTNRLRINSAGSELFSNSSSNSSTSSGCSSEYLLNSLKDNERYNLKHLNSFKTEEKQANTDYNNSTSLQQDKLAYSNSDKLLVNLETNPEYHNKQPIRKNRTFSAPLNKVINVQKPKYTEYVVLQTRINSFDENWPSSLDLSPTTMAVAGYYYTGQSDFVRCFFCGGGLKSWHNGDDPWKEHARWFPRCMFLLQNQGIQYVEEETVKDIEQDNAVSLVTDTDYTTTTISSPSVCGSMCASASNITSYLSYGADQTSKRHDYFLSCTAAESVEHSGFNSQQIFHAIKEWASENKKKSIEELKASYLMGILIDQYDGQKPIKKSVNELKPNNSELESIIREHATTKEDEICSVCKEKTKQIALLPCGDIVACRLCSMALYECPECNQRVKATVRVYFS